MYKHNIDISLQHGSRPGTCDTVGLKVLKSGYLFVLAAIEMTKKKKKQSKKFEGL